MTFIKIALSYEKKGEQKENPDWRGHTKVMHRRGGTFLSSAPGILKSAKFGIVRKLCQASVWESVSEQ